MNRRFSRDVQRRRDELVDRAYRSDTADELFQAVASRLRRLVPFDVLLWMPTDPDTGLASAPTRAENLDPSHQRCVVYFRGEFFGGDVNAVADLARSPIPAATLLAAPTTTRPAAPATASGWSHRV